MSALGFIVMRPMRALARFGLWASTGTLALGLGCGRARDDEGSSGGSLGDVGGSVAVGGKFSGGSGSGGSGGGAASGGGPAVGGSTTGGTGAGGASSTCATPPYSECSPGEGSLVFYDLSTGTCRPAHGVCFGEDVFGFSIFKSLAECLGTCEGSKPSAEACDVDSDCVMDFGCCGPCAPVELSETHAVNAKVGPSDCGDVLCGACPEVSEVQQNYDYFWPICQNHVCTVVDLTQSSSGECKQSSECFLQDGAGCCPGCDGSGLVPLSNADYLKGRCNDIGCPACIGPTPTSVTAMCNPDTNHCEKVELLPQ